MGTRSQTRQLDGGCCTACLCSFSFRYICEPLNGCFKINGINIPIERAGLVAIVLVLQHKHAVAGVDGKGLYLVEG